MKPKRRGPRWRQCLTGLKRDDTRFEALSERIEKPSRGLQLSLLTSTSNSPSQLTLLQGFPIWWVLSEQGLTLSKTSENERSEHSERTESAARRYGATVSPRWFAVFHSKMRRDSFHHISKIASETTINLSYVVFIVVAQRRREPSDTRGIPLTVRTGRSSREPGPVRLDHGKSNHFPLTTMMSTVNERLLSFPGCCMEFCLPNCKSPYTR